MTCDGDDVIDDEEHHADDYRESKSAFTYDGSQWCSYEEKQQTCYAERELLVKDMLVFPDIGVLTLEVFYVEVDVVDLVLYRGSCHVDDRGLLFFAKVI